jgi:hypothetical protein
MLLGRASVARLRSARARLPFQAARISALASKDNFVPRHLGPRSSDVPEMLKTVRPYCARPRPPLRACRRAL